MVQSDKLKIFLGMFGLVLMCMSQATQLTPVFDFARCSGRRKMKYLIRRWVKMKGKRERIRVRWRQRGRAGHSSSYMPIEKCSIPTMHIQGAGEFRRGWIKACVKSQA